MTREKLFSKRVRARRLKAYPELTALGIGWGASLIIGLLLLAGCYDRETGLRLGGGALFAALYLFAGALCLVLYIAARIRVAAGGGIPLRRLGYLAILTAFTGNVFAAIAGFSIIREKRSLEYELCYYALLNDLLVMLISLLNYFKDVLAAYFYVGIGLLAATVVLYLAALVAIERAQASGHYRRLAPLAVVLILSAGLGNLFALLLGLVILVRIKNEGNARTIQWVDTIRRIYRNYMAVLGFLIISLLFTLAVVSAFTFHYGYAVSNDYGNLLREPCLEYPFGTDNLGLCVFTRIVFGARISLIIGIISTAVPIVVGGLLGAMSGYYSERLDNGIMRILDVLYAIVAAFGANTLNLIVALSISNVPVYARTMRAQVMRWRPIPSSWRRPAPAAATSGRSWSSISSPTPWPRSSSAPR